MLSALSASSSEFENIDDQNGKGMISSRKKAAVLLIALLVLCSAFLVLRSGGDADKTAAHTSTLKRAQMQQTLANYPCPAGSVETGKDATGRCVCERCQVGHSCAGGTAGEVPCAEGTYQGLEGQEVCEIAQPGYFAPGEKNTAPQPCLAGTFQAKARQGSCDPAERGFKVPNDASATQMECDPGQYQPATSQTACLDSPTGHFATGPGAIYPEPCLPGTYQDQTGQAVCKDAEMGNFVATGGSDKQTPCHFGSYAPGVKAFECDSAAAGYHVPVMGSSTQEACLDLFYQPCTAQKECIPCPTGSASMGIGQTKCVVEQRYLRSQTPMDYTAAKAFCATHNMQVVEAITAKQQADALAYCRQNSNNVICWLGMQRDASSSASNNFRWEKSGGLVGTGLFPSNEPNNAGGNEGCGEMLTSVNGQYWNDIACAHSARVFALCQSTQ